MLMSTARHVWALDGDVQSCHRMPTFMVDKECAGFHAAVTDVVAPTPFLTFPMDLSSIFWRRQERGVRTIGWPRKRGTFEANPGHMLTQGWQLGFLRLLDSCGHHQPTDIGVVDICHWGSYCDVTVDPCAACRGIATMLARKALLPMWQWEDPWTSCLNLRGVRRWTPMGVARVFLDHDRNGWSCQ